jgi:hypothetical protein
MRSMVHFDCNKLFDLTRLKKIYGHIFLAIPTMALKQVATARAGRDSPGSRAARHPPLSGKPNPSKNCNWLYSI